MMIPGNTANGRFNQMEDYGEVFAVDFLCEGLNAPKPIGAAVYVRGTRFEALMAGKGRIEAKDGEVVFVETVAS